MKGIVIEIKPEKYIVNILEEEKEIEATKTGNVKKNNRILVGDYVNVTYTNNTYVIDNVAKRKNSLIRPPIANLDQLICVVSAAHPLPDLMVLDKQILMCEKFNINPVICINKIDEEKNELYQYIIETYSKIGYIVIEVSAKTGKNIDKLKEIMSHKISAFSGLSGVGKSSLIKNIFDKQNIEVGELTEKINRGKHTTKYVKLYKINNGYIADTPGFSSLELIEEIEKDELKTLYKEFLKYPCKYNDCNHVTESEKECKVKENLGTNIDIERYNRYTKLYEVLKEKDKNKYKK